MRATAPSAWRYHASRAEVARPAARERGAVLVETALVTGMILTILLFSVQIGLLGFLQITADAASLVDAHLSAVGVANSNDTPGNSTVAAFPQLAPSDITTTPQPAPTASIPVDYGYNGTQQEQQASQSSRTGGASLLQPTLIQSQVSPHQLFNMFGNAVGVSALDAEPMWEECGVHYNESNATNLSCTATTTSGDTFNTNYFNDGENTPPYYVGFNDMEVCTDSQPWQTCPDNSFLSLGVGEFLDAGTLDAGGVSGPGNWGRPNPGASGPAAQATFYEAAFHQRCYATIAQFFNSYSNLYDLYEQYMGQKQAGSISKALFKGAPANYANWSEFEVPAAADGGIGHNADQDLDTVYGWDQVVSGAPQGQPGGPGSTPLNPGGGACV